jgi:protein involved in polysaccharide export with SLBB domain
MRPLDFPLIFLGVAALFGEKAIAWQAPRSGGPAGTEAALRAPAPAALETAYRLEAGDEIEVKFVLNPEYNERAQIRPDGRVSLPGIGEITAAGATVADLTAQLKSAYKFLRNPDPTVEVRSYGNRRVYVGGEVVHPGAQVVLGPKTVVQAIVESGGVKESAHRGSVILIRRTPEGIPATFNVAMNRGGKAPDATTTMVQPFDVILVPESGISKLDRAVDQYVRKMIPALLTGGFTYLYGNTNTYVPR